MRDEEESPPTVHVFVGEFPTRADACEYTEAQWEPEPDENSSAEEYAAWDERNPSWALRKDLDIYLDSDFIETIDGDERYSYLESLLEEKGSISEIRDKAPEGANIVVLVFVEALGGHSAEVTSTEKLTYCGEYRCRH